MKEIIKYESNDGRECNTKEDALLLDKQREKYDYVRNKYGYKSFSFDTVMKMIKDKKLKDIIDKEEYLNKIKTLKIYIPNKVINTLEDLHKVLEKVFGINKYELIEIPVETIGDTVKKIGITQVDILEPYPDEFLEQMNKLLNEYSPVHNMFNITCGPMLLTGK